MARIVCAILFFVLPMSLQPQNLERIDSLRKLSTQPGQDKFKILTNLAWEYRLVNPDSTIKIGKRAYEMGRKLGIEKGLAQPLNFIGVGYEYQANTADAYAYFTQALSIATDQRDDIQIAYSNNNLGRLFVDQGNILSALKAYQKALTIFEEKEDLAGMASVHLSLAQYYQSQKDYDKAEEYFLKVYETRKKIESEPNISSIQQLGIFYREIGKMEKSNRYLLMADSLCAIRNNEVLRANINVHLARNRLIEQKYEEAEAFAQKAIKFSERKGINTKRVFNVLGKIKFQEGNYAKAKEYFNIVLSGTKTFKEYDIRMDAYYYLSQIYDKEGAVDKKLQNQNQYLFLKDSISSMELNKQIDRLKFQFNLELEQKRVENELLKTLDSKNNEIIKKQRTINSIYVIALAVIIVIAFLLFRNATIKNRLNVELEKKQEKILRQAQQLKTINLEIEKINTNLEKTVNERTATIKEKNKLLTEYAHFNSHQIRGPLARILGLIQLIRLEYKDSYGSHVEMLHQAGNDLDAAIHQINKLIDDVSETPDEG